ncbi:MAG: leucine-rich repeat domain-containing protein [Oscillospiraceae bacterium]|nr:leucine-rich repeat domain-containing protein [Oscillospiraceae bacterium]
MSGYCYRNGYNAFYNCTSLESITIPESVTKIGKSVFYNCTSLKKITISESVTEIGETAFEGCSEELEVTYGSTTYKYNQLPNLYKKING